MQTIKNLLPVLVVVSFLFGTACNDSATKTENKDADTATASVTQSDSLQPGYYDAALDPVNVGPAFIKELHDTLGIQILEGELKPGDSIGLHGHPDHAIYVLQGGTMAFYLPGQSKERDTASLPAGTAWIGGPVKDASRNTGKTAVKWVEVNVYRPNEIQLPAKPAYDSAIDAYTLGGPSTKKLADSLGIKLFIVTMKPGDTATLHSHPDHTVYVLEGGEIAVTFGDGTRQVMKLNKGMGFVGIPFSDAAKNTGKTTVKLLMTHIYRQR